MAGSLWTFSKCHRLVLELMLHIVLTLVVDSIQKLDAMGFSRWWSVTMAKNLKHGDHKTILYERKHDTFPVYELSYGPWWSSLCWRGVHRPGSGLRPTLWWEDLWIIISVIVWTFYWLYGFSNILPKRLNKIDLLVTYTLIYIYIYCVKHRWQHFLNYIYRNIVTGIIDCVTLSWSDLSIMYDLALFNLLFLVGGSHT